MEKALEFKRKALKVEAIQFDGKNVEAVKTFAAENGGTAYGAVPNSGILHLDAAGERQSVASNDWIVRDPWEGFLVLDGKQFAMIYEGI